MGHRGGSTVAQIRKIFSKSIQSALKVSDWKFLPEFIFLALSCLGEDGTSMTHWMNESGRRDPKSSQPTSTILGIQLAAE